MSVNFVVGDCLTSLRAIPSDTFDCIVTSPPYWNLRDYGGGKNEIGMESTPTTYLKKMVEVCRELRRVLKPTGTFWLNIGDTYAVSSIKDDPFKPKDLCMIPNRLALLLLEDGWYVRSEIIWYKQSCMPSPVRDRPTNAHEKVWLLTKSPQYFYDFDAVSVKAKHSPQSTHISPERLRALIKKDGDRPHFSWQYADPNRIWGSGMSNLRNVWTVNQTHIKNESHAATMPLALAERCIKAGCPKGGRVLDPFGGAGTTGLVADRLGRHCTLLELNPKYVEMAKQSISEDRMNRRLRKNISSQPVYNKPSRSFLSTFKRPSK